MKVYNNYDYEERLYSTGSDELDDLLERAFCEGYEYAQKEFAIGGAIGKTLNQIGRNNQARAIKNFRKGKGVAVKTFLGVPEKIVSASKLNPTERTSMASSMAKSAQKIYPKGGEYSPLTNYKKWI